MVNSIYIKEPQLVKTKHSDNVASFLDLDLSIENGIIISKIYDTRDDFNFDIINFPNLEGYVSRATSFGVSVSQLIHFARSCSKVEEFNIRNLSITSNGFNSGLMAGQGKLVVALFRRKAVTAH